MFTLAPFSQDTLLRLRTTDPVLRNGVCVALCDYWLALIRGQPDQSATERLDLLDHNFSRIMSHQSQYAQLRSRRGREAARQQVGAQIGLNYDTDKTVIGRAFIGMHGIRARMARDIGVIGASATWTMRFAGGGGHAIAGFCNVIGREPILKMQLHVFDPNIGEYVGELGDLDAILGDLFNRFPLYATVNEVFRASADW